MQIDRKKSRKQNKNKTHEATPEFCGISDGLGYLGRIDPLNMHGFLDFSVFVFFKEERWIYTY